MNTGLIVKRLNSYAVFLRYGRPLEVTEEIITLLHEIFSNIVGKNDNELLVLQKIFSSILRCQESEDWLGLADYLEYELPAFLKSVQLD